MTSVAAGKIGNRFVDLLWEVYQYPSQHPEAEELVKDRESKAWKYKSETDQGFDEFGLALRTLQTMALKAIPRKAIYDCKKGEEASRLLEEILNLLENSFNAKEIQASGGDDIDNFIDAARELGDAAREAM